MEASARSQNYDDAFSDRNAPKVKGETLPPPPGRIDQDEWKKNRPAINFLPLPPQRAQLCSMNKQEGNIFEGFYYRCCYDSQEAIDSRAKALNS